ncbi:MAG: tRNA pseudouridine(55) synthase TruB [Candidatus Eremiobacteraeota bacterium]|nr:tRNA pseudouridine(55) synthase TruB [Candidatus Eremiobacteraeota bacterium]
MFKPAGPSSAQTVARLRRVYGVHGGDRKIAAGHLGTLDPQAAGVLPVAIGKATRLIPLLADRRKIYSCTLVFGRSTTTGDALGDTLAYAAVPSDWRARLEAALPALTGRITQTPPMFSALHHQGRRLYSLARQGAEVERRPRLATIYALTILGTDDAGIARLRIACSEGTYVRALCHELGEATQIPAHMGALVRETSGPFVLYEALTLDEIAAEPLRALVAPENIIPFPTIVLDLRGSADFRAGRVVPLPQGAGARHVFVRDESRTLVGVGEALGALLAPRKVFV